MINSNRNNKSWFSRFYRSRYFLICAIIILSLVIFGYVRAYFQDYKIKQEIKGLQEEVNRLQTKKIESLDILRYVTSPDFVEERARLELNMRLPGEKVLVMPSAGDKQVSVDEEKKAENLDNPIKWWYYFTHQAIDTTN